MFAGTRVPVRSLFDYLEAGETLHEFLTQSRDALLHVLGQHLVNQRLVADLSPPSFLPELIQNVRVHSDGD